MVANFATISLTDSGLRTPTMNPRTYADNLPYLDSSPPRRHGFVDFGSTKTTTTIVLEPREIRQPICTARTGSGMAGTTRGVDAPRRKVLVSFGSPSLIHNDYSPASSASSTRSFSSLPQPNRRACDIPTSTSTSTNDPTSTNQLTWSSREFVSARTAAAPHDRVATRGGRIGGVGVEHGCESKVRPPRSRAGSQLRHLGPSHPSHLPRGRRIVSHY